MSRLRAIWPQKTDLELAARLKLSDRQCRKILAARANLTLEAFGTLCRSEDGPELLEAFMGEEDAPAWWREIRREIEKRRLRRRLEVLERE